MKEKFLADKITSSKYRVLGSQEYLLSGTATATATPSQGRDPTVSSAPSAPG